MAPFLLPDKPQYALITIILPHKILDAPQGLEPRLTESKSALLPLEDGATSKQVLLYMFCQTLSNILDARLGLEPRTY